MASGAETPGQNRLFLGSQALDSGAVAVVAHGALRLRSVVSQGCRPIGQPYVITQADRNLILQLGGMSALTRLREVFDSLPTHEQLLVQQGLHIGRVVSEYQERFEHGDFLIRNVIGIDQESGAVAVGDHVRTGQTVQFHIRDQKTADDDLRQLLAQVPRDAVSARAALLFTCNGRGSRLFDHAHHDAQAVRSSLGEIPLAGFFAQGELGPVAGQNFVHGFTASLALWEAVNGAP
jgi:small ligand-binding sensory domain FIST